jgi:hypothetical protein
MTFCLLPPDRLEIGSDTDCARMSNSTLRSSALARIAPQVERHSLRERRIGGAVEDEVLGDREVADEAVVLAVLGHEAHARVDGGPR